jgi:hypothetical protein
VYLTIRDRAGKNCVLRLSSQFSVNPLTYARDELEGILGPGSVKLA